MAKLHLDGGVTFEGTPEEIKAYTDLYAVKGAEKPEALELKAGDWVKFTEDGTDITAGKKYEVKADDDGDLYLIDDGGDDRTYPISGDSDYQFEIVAPPTAFERIGRKEGEFKVGDIVKLNQDSGAHAKGAIVEIITSGLYRDSEGETYLGEYEWYELVAPVESRVDRSNRGDASCD